MQPQTVNGASDARRCKGASSDGEPMKKPKHKYAVRTFRDGSKEWSRDGKLHRDGDMPASEGADGTKMWFRDGQLHRGGSRPAVVRADGTKMWYRDGQLHRDGDRPAIVWANGIVEYWVDGKRASR